MRTLFLSLAVCALCLSALAQTPLTLPRKAQHYSWYPSTSSWRFTEEFTYAYNSRGQETEVTHTNGDWYSRTVKAYIDFQLTETISQSWSQLTNSWEVNGKASYLYDEQGRIASVTSQHKSNGTLVNSSRELREYTGDNPNPTTIVYQNWLPSTNNWVNLTRFINYTWDTSGSNPFGYTGYEVQTAIPDPTASWVSIELVSTSYDPATRTLTFTLEKLSGSSWFYSSRGILTYDEKMNMISLLNQEWKENAWAFIEEQHNSYTYNDSNVLTEVVSKYSSLEGAELINANRVVYSDFQTFLVTGLAEQLPETSLSVFPNPTTDEVRVVLKNISFKEAQVELINTQGIRVYTGTIPHQALTSETHVVSTEHLGPGMYILRIVTDNNQKISRRVLKH